MALTERKVNLKNKRARRLRQSVGLGKFDACLMHPLANIHYVLAPAGMLQKKDLPQALGAAVAGRGGNQCHR